MCRVQDSQGAGRALTVLSLVVVFMLTSTGAPPESTTVQGVGQDSARNARHPFAVSSRDEYLDGFPRHDSKEEAERTVGCAIILPQSTLGLPMTGIYSSPGFEEQYAPPAVFVRWGDGKRDLEVHIDHWWTIDQAATYLETERANNERDPDWTNVAHDVEVGPFEGFAVRKVDIPAVFDSKTGQKERGTGIRTLVSRVSWVVGPDVYIVSSETLTVEGLLKVAESMTFE